MFFRMMTEGVLEGAPLLEAGIYRLMTSPNITFLLLVKVGESWRKLECADIIK
jgi:hypothetical protein